MMIDRRVYIVDDDGPVRATIRRILTAAGIYAEEFSSCAEFLEAEPSLPAGCILLDLRLPGMSGLELLGILRERNVRSPVVMISGQADVPDAVRAIKAGALDFIQKPFRRQQLLGAVTKAFEALAASDEADAFRRSVALTPREADVLRAMAKGATSKEIARELGLSGRTVEMHRANLLQKFGAKNATLVVLRAKELGLL